MSSSAELEKRAAEAAATAEAAAPATAKGEPPLHVPAPSSVTKAETARSTVVFAIAAYATCSSVMLVINKVAVHLLPAPSVVLFFQLLTSALAVVALDRAGLVQSEPLVWAKVKPFLLVVVAFLGALFTNVKTLQHANVETFIVFRSSTPLLIAFLDYAFLGRELPNRRSWASLAAIVAGAALYVHTDHDFEVRAYSWVLAWVVVFVFDQTYIKWVCDTVPMSSWGRVFYTNSLSVLPVTLLGLAFGEVEVMREFEWETAAVTALAASCACGARSRACARACRDARRDAALGAAAGVGMSYSAFLLRGLVSATSFTVVGIMCKVATVVINCLIWDKHASPAGLGALSICLLAGTLYQQAPLRAKQ